MTRIIVRGDRPQGHQAVRGGCPSHWREHIVADPLRAAHNYLFSIPAFCLLCGMPDQV